MTRLMMLEKQEMLCRAITVYPQTMTVDRLASVMGTSVQTIRGMILKMTNRCLISEDEVNGKPCYFYPEVSDKRKTLSYIQERINTLRRR